MDTAAFGAGDSRIDKARNVTDPRDGRLDEAGRIAVRATLSWSGWGSPIGLSVFVLSAGLFVMCLHRSGLLR